MDIRLHTCPCAKNGFGFHDECDGKDAPVPKLAIQHVQSTGGQRVHDRSALDNGGRARIIKLMHIYQSRNEGRAMTWHRTKKEAQSKGSGLGDSHTVDEGPRTFDTHAIPHAAWALREGKRLHLHAGQLVAPGAGSKCKSAAHVCTQRNCKIGS